MYHHKYVITSQLVQTRMITNMWLERVIRMLTSQCGHNGFLPSNTASKQLVISEVEMADKLLLFYFTDSNTREAILWFLTF